MPHFFTGDDLGSLKSISYTASENSKEWKTATTLLVPGSSGSSPRKTVQKLALHRIDDSDILLASAHADGSAAVHRIHSEEGLHGEVVQTWAETRMKADQRYIGLAATDSAVYTCTSNGSLRLTKPGQEGSDPSFSLASLPMRLCEWRLSNDARYFAYGGEEVEMSVWDTEKAFSSTRDPLPDIGSVESKKRKRGDQLLPGEVWRARNVPNDHLSLRQPVHNTAFSFLQPSFSIAHQHIIAGTGNGNVRRYDCRAGRRPVSDWKGIGKVGGISMVEKGSHEHAVFVADRGCTLSVLDLRNGKTMYTYKSISGAVNSVAPAGAYAASVSQDRFVRLHSSFGPPAEVGQQQEHKGEVLEKTYVKVIPTAVVWDEDITDADGVERGSEEEDEDGADDVWDNMEDVESDPETEAQPSRRKVKKMAS